MINFNGLNGSDIFEHFKSRTLMELSVKELAYIHLEYRYPTNLKSCQVLSSLQSLNETLSASFNNSRTDIYVPLMVSFAILEQIGTIYQPKIRNNKYENGIKKSLAAFSNFPKSELNTLVTLRHGLLHDGSLVGVNQNTHTKVFFRLTTGKDRVITPPDVIWDGVYRDNMEAYVTLIDLRALQRLVLGVVDTCRMMLISDKLSIATTEPKEFFYRYLFAK